VRKVVIVENSAKRMNEKKIDHKKVGYEYILLKENRSEE
jgi:hypothetical protein